MAIIELDNVSFSYREGAKAPNRLELRIATGEFLCVIGGTGSSKSALARHVSALLAPDEGAAHVNVHDTRDAGVLAMHPKALVSTNPQPTSIDIPQLMQLANASSDAKRLT